MEKNFESMSLSSLYLLQISTLIGEMLNIDSIDEGDIKDVGLNILKDIFDVVIHYRKIEKEHTKSNILNFDYIKRKKQVISLIKNPYTKRNKVTSD